MGKRYHGIKKRWSFLFFSGMYLFLSCLPGKACAQSLGGVTFIEHKSNTYQQATVKDTQEVALLIDKGTNYFNKQSLDSAIGFFQDAYALSKTINFPDGSAKALVNISRAYFNSATLSSSPYLDSAIAYAHLALSYCDKGGVKNKRYTAWAYQNLGASYTLKNNIPKGKTYYYKALDALQQYQLMTDTYIVCEIYINLGSLPEVNITSSNQAMGYLHKARSMIGNSDDKKYALLQGKLEIAQGNLWYNASQYTKAIHCFYRALEIGARNENIIFQAHALCMLTTLYAGLGNTDSTRYFLERTKAMTIQYPGMMSPSNRMNYYMAAGLAHFLLEDWPQAKKELLLLHNLSSNHTISMAMLEQMHLMLSAIFEKEQNMKQAYFHLKAANELTKKILADNDIKTYNDLLLRYQTSEKDKEIAAAHVKLLGSQNSLQKQNIWIILIISSSIILCMLITYLLYRRRHREEILRLKAGIKGEEKERQRMARELHDGIVSNLTAVKMNFNAINHTHIDGIEGDDTFKSSLQQLEQSIKEIRDTSHNLQPDILKEAGLAVAIDLYCQKMGEVSSIKIDFQVSGVLPYLSPEFELNVYRIIQELVMNSIKHAKASHIHISIGMNGHFLELDIHDNGMGMNDASIQEGIGMFNIQDRVKLLRGNIQIESRNGTRIALNFPLDKWHKKTVA